MVKPLISVQLLSIFLLISVQFTSGEDSDTWIADFNSTNKTSIILGEPKQIQLFLDNLNLACLKESNAIIRVVSRDPGIMEISKIISLDDIDDGKWSGNFTVVAKTLGSANVVVEIEFQRPNKCTIIEVSSESLEIEVLRNHNIINIDHLFSPHLYFYFRHIFFVFLNAACGAALDLDKIKAILGYPVGPCVTFVFDFILYPIVSCQYLLFTIFFSTFKEFEFFE